MSELKYLTAYSDQIQAQVLAMLDQNTLGDFILQRHPKAHSFSKDASLREYALNIKNQYMKKSAPINKVVYDAKLHIVKNALGTHTYAPRVQGAKIKTKNEIRISSIFKVGPEAFLNMIVVHELAHIKEKQHNKAFYQLCVRMLEGYHQLEFETRLYLTQLETKGPIY
jgi:predicted metal-dependent hydrolase